MLKDCSINIETPACKLNNRHVVNIITFMTLADAKDRQETKAIEVHQ